MAPQVKMKPPRPYMMAWRLLTRMTMKPISVLPSILVVVSNHIKGTNVSFRPSHALKNSIQIEKKTLKLLNFLYTNTSKLIWRYTLGKNPHFIQKFTCLKSHTSKNLYFQNRMRILKHLFFNKDRIWKISFFIKITFQMPIFIKSHCKNHIFHNNQTLEATFSQKSQFQKLIYHKCHIIPNIKFKWIYG